jgi:hypothetical protein
MIGVIMPGLVYSGENNIARSAGWIRKIGL